MVSLGIGTTDAAMQRLGDSAKPRLRRLVVTAFICCVVAVWTFIMWGAASAIIFFWGVALP